MTMSTMEQDENVGCVDQVEHGDQKSRGPRFQGQDLLHQDQVDDTTPPPEDQQHERPQDQEEEEELTPVGPDHDDVGMFFELDDSWREFVNTTMGDQDKAAQN